jgi:hypothetical protein
MAAKYAFYAHLDAPVYEHLTGVSQKLNQSKSYVVTEALKRLDIRTLQPKQKQRIETASPNKWSIQEPLGFFANR